MRIYEELFIVRHDATEEEITPLLDQLKSVITKSKGTVDKVDDWGVKKLAYRVKKRAEGRYILIQFSSGPETVKELERRLRVSDLVLKFITVRQDIKMKMDAKMRKKREARAARKPVMQTVSPGLVMPSGEGPSGSTPGAPAPGAPAPVTMPAAPAPAAPAAPEAVVEAVVATAPVPEAPAAAAEVKE
jgi:small subunit ribosomal protein S6